jgi:two-component system, NarL family, nitrate/nitrite response regulator NarL
MRQGDSRLAEVTVMPDRQGLHTIRLFLLDDHALFREGLARLLEGQPGFVIAGKADSSRTALAQLGSAQADIVLLDVDLGADRALDFVRSARQQSFEGRILVVTAGVSDAEAIQLVQAGVAGILHKHNPPDALCDAIRRVAAGEVHLEPRYLRPLFSSMDETGDAPPRLTTRELAIMRLVLRGLANKEIGADLNISESAVKAALRVIFDKVGVRTRSQLVKIAIEQYRDQL